MHKETHSPHRRIADHARKAALVWYENCRAMLGAHRGIGSFMGEAAESVEERTKDTTANWKKEGLPSKKIAVLLGSAMNKETPPDTRVQFLAAIHSVMQQHTGQGSTDPEILVMSGAVMGSRKGVTFTDVNNEGERREE